MFGLGLGLSGWSGNSDRKWTYRQNLGITNIAIPIGSGHTDKTSELPTLLFRYEVDIPTKPRNYQHCYSDRKWTYRQNLGITNIAIPIGSGHTDKTSELPTLLFR